MTRKTSHRIVVATALAALFAGGIANAAVRAPQEAGHDRAEQRHDRRKAAQERREDRREDRREAAQGRREERRDVAQDHRDDRREWQQDRRDDRRDAMQAQRDATPRSRDGAQLQRVIRAQHDDRRDARYERRDDRRDWRDDRRDDRRDWRQDRREDARRDAQRRQAYARYRQDYDHRMRSHVQVRIVPRYYVRPAHYRYGYGGRWYSTSNYGAEMLRMAVQNGYREGLRAGRADRYDGWPGGFRDSFAWRDAAYGFGPGYISRADYAYYFRQGFERGYDDGYYGRLRYGRYVSNEAVIIDAVLGAILNLQMLR